MPKKLELTGKRFGSRVVIRESGRSPAGRVLWLVRCDCGNEQVLGSGFRNSPTCKKCENKRFTEQAKQLRPSVQQEYKSTYRSWIAARNRCNNPSHHAYDRYGGRGIKFCERWDDFMLFLKDMGERPDGMSLDRIDNDGNYEPGNCRWATRGQQGSNKRNNVTLTHNGKTQTISQWSRETGIKFITIWARIQSGWSDSDCLKQP